MSEIQDSPIYREATTEPVRGLIIPEWIAPEVAFSDAFVGRLTRSEIQEFGEVIDGLCVDMDDDSKPSLIGGLLMYAVHTVAFDAMLRGTTIEEQQYEHLATKLENLAAVSPGLALFAAHEMSSKDDNLASIKKLMMPSYAKEHASILRKRVKALGIPVDPADKPENADDILALWGAYMFATLSGNEKELARLGETIEWSMQKFAERDPQSADEIQFVVRAMDVANPLNKLREVLEAFGDDAPALVARIQNIAAFSDALSLVEKAMLDPAAAQKDMRKLLAFFSQQSIIAHLEALNAGEEIEMSFTDAPETTEIGEVLKPMELDWEILPPGELEQNAREIVEQYSGREVQIDLSRLNILESIRNTWGTEACYYARGSLGKRHVIRDGEQEQPDQYILLVLQEFDALGNVRLEHAVAESPIAGRNALYVYRQDVSGEDTNWRHIMSLPKPAAQALGARKMQHTVSEGDDLNDSMREKALILLTAPPNEFHATRFRGKGRTSILKNVVELG